MNAKEVRTINRRRARMQVEDMVLMQSIPVLCLGVEVQKKELVIMAYHDLSLGEMRTMLSDYLRHLDAKLETV
jgi:hypothetical protein